MTTRHQGYDFNKHGRGPLVDATYQIPLYKTLGFRQEGFFHVFPIKALNVKHMTPRAGPVFAPGIYNSNILVSVLLGDAKYQISIV